MPPSGIKGLLVVGGQGGNSMGQGSPSSAEFWARAPQETHCLLPELPRPMWQPTVEVVGSRALVCEKTGCLWLEKGGWQEGPDTVEMRRYHTSALTDEGVLLVGGMNSPTTTELVPLHGGESRASFVLARGRREHCSIQTGPNSFVLTGGHLEGGGASNLVTEFTILGIDQPEPKDLPLLTQSRFQHACGAYNIGETKMLIVTGGEYGGDSLGSTEVMVYGSQGKWREVGDLPSPKVGLRGATVDGIFFVSGGGITTTSYTNDLTSFDPVSETWTSAGDLTFSRKWHAVAEIDLSNIPANCSFGSKYI